MKKKYGVLFLIALMISLVVMYGTELGIPGITQFYDQFKLLDMQFTYNYNTVVQTFLQIGTEGMKHYQMYLLVDLCFIICLWLVQAYLIGGGAMMAEPMLNSALISEKTNFIGYSYSQIFDDSSKCKNCGGCTRHCPMNLEVLKMVQLMEKGNSTEAKQYHPDQCIRCGTCSYYCRAGKNIKGMIAKLTED